MSITTEARFKMQDGTEALYVGEAADMPALPPWPFLAIHVADLDAARDLIEVLERSRARKRASEKDEDPTAKEPEPRCIAPGCPIVGAISDVGGHVLCSTHAGAPDSTKAEWRRAKEKEQGRKRARGIREGVEGEPGKVA